MPKIALTYTGDDEAVIARLKPNEGVQYFEPIDAREVLATPGAPYEIHEESRKLIGVQFEARGHGDTKLSVPQLQGDDAELQTGLSHEKYGRSQVVKAVPDAQLPNTQGPQSTIGRPLSGPADADNGGGAQAARMGDGGDTNPDAGAKNSEGMTLDEIRHELKARGVEYDKGMRKDELAKLLDEQK